MNKSSLRKLYLEKRKTLSDKEFEKRNRLIFENFFNTFNLEEIEIVHTFLPITKSREIDTWHIIKEISQKMPHIQILITKTIIETLEMENLILTEQTILKENQWGIPEPESGEQVHEHGIDLVITPLLTFDKKGNRVGYGKGFYDRFFKKCRPDAVKVGLSLEPPIESIDDVNEFDVKMDFCITPDKVYKF
jgi:5-formyltetrahydrofolate cyclo-ligase